LVQPYADSLFPKTGGHVDEMLLHVRKENNEQTMNHSDENHTHKFFDDHYSWLWNLMDSTTRFWICSRLVLAKDVTFAGLALLKEMKQRASLPKEFVHDGLRVYDDFKKVADFSETQFSAGVDFSECEFSGKADFHGTSFFDTVYFIKCKFLESTDFKQAVFSGTGDFFSLSACFD